MGTLGYVAQPEGVTTLVRYDGFEVELIPARTRTRVCRPLHGTPCDLDVGRRYSVVTGLNAEKVQVSARLPLGRREKAATLLPSFPPHALPLMFAAARVRPANTRLAGTRSPSRQAFLVLVTLAPPLRIARLAERRVNSRGVVLRLM